MNDENWKEEFKQWKPGLKAFQIKLLEEETQSLSQALMLNDMWCQWKDLAVKRKLDETASKSLVIEDPWTETVEGGKSSCNINKSI